jgi:hypothetical protein
MVNHRDRARAVNQTYFPEDPAFAGGFLEPGGGYPILFPLWDFSFDRNNNFNYDIAVASGLASMTSGGLCFVLRRRRRELEDAAPSDPVVMRTMRTHRCAVAAVSALTVTVSVATMGYAVWEMAAPGIAGAGFPSEVVRLEGVSEFLSFGVLGTASGLLLRGALRDLGPLTPTAARSTASKKKKTTARKSTR